MYGFESFFIATYVCLFVLVAFIYMVFFGLLVLKIRV